MAERYGYSNKKVEVNSSPKIDSFSNPEVERQPGREELGREPDSVSKDITKSALEHHPEQPILTETEISKEEMPLVEEIAQFRMEFEEKIFFEGIPAGEWDRVYQETLDRHKNLFEYKELFADVLRSVKSANLQLEQVWEKSGGAKSRERNERLHTLGAVASPEVAKRLFQSIFRFEPQEVVEAVKGALTLRFTVGDHDNAIVSQSASESVTIDGTTHRIARFTFPIIVTRSASDDAFIVLLHELEHAKDRFFKEARDNFVFEKRLQNISSNIRALIQRENRARRSIALERGKSELLAYFTIFDRVDFSQFTPKQIYEEILNYNEEVKKRLTDPDGAYSMLLDSSEHDTIAKGITALSKLFELYYQSGKIEPARMAINVLEQFPLESWPAAVRLLKAKHNKKEA